MIGFVTSLILMPLVIALVAVIGYFVGVLVSYIPLVNDLLTKGLGLGTEAIPTILSWVFVVVIIRTWFDNVGDDDA